MWNEYLFLNWPVDFTYLAEFKQIDRRKRK